MVAVRTLKPPAYPGKVALSLPPHGVCCITYTCRVYLEMMVGTKHLVMAVLAIAASAAPAQANSVWYRFTLSDGRVVDAQLVGGDANNYFISTPQGQTYSLARSTVTGAVALQAPQPPVVPQPYPLYQPPPQPIVYQQPLPPPTDGMPRASKFSAGLGTFAGAYLITASIAIARDDEDDDAKLGLVPVLGPILWTASDEGDWGDDGYDWLGALSAFVQGAGAYGMIAGKLDDDNKPAAKTVRITPSAGRGMAYVIVGGRF